MKLVEVFALVTVFASSKPCWVFCANEDAIPSTMCPRFSVHEFYESLFKPLLMKRLDFVENVLKLTSDGVEEMLVKYAEKKGDDSDMTKTVMNNVRVNGMKAINKARIQYEEAWKDGLDKFQLLTEWRDFFQKQIEMLDETENELTQPFAEMVHYSKSLMDPIVEILVKMMESKSPEEQLEHREKMMNTFESRDKILGYVMGKLVFTKLDQKVMEQELLLAPIKLFASQLNDDFYMNARKIPIDRFWKQFLLPNWPLKYKEQTKEEQLEEMVNILSSMFYHKPHVELEDLE